MKECMKEFVTRSWSKEEKFLTVLSAALLGIMVGCLLSPFKNGFQMFCNNGSDNGSNNSNNGVPQDIFSEEEMEEEICIEE